MLLQKSLKVHLAKLGGACSGMKLWGKIKGNNFDYYIAEGILEGGGDPEGEDVPVATEVIEPRGTGVNKFVYWVCNSPNGTWE